VIEIQNKGSMLKMVTRILAAVVMAGFVFATGAKAESNAFVTSKSLTPEVALDLAKATLDACRKSDFQVTVAVVDRSGVLQVILRDRFAGPHTPETARRKAYTAVSFRTDTLEMSDLTQAGKEPSGIRHLPGVAMIGGGVMVRSAGALVGAVGVSGAPGGKADEDCAKKGIEKIQDRLDF
jgi:uncharacterized protein GlcG (DUF336 family)